MSDRSGVFDDSKKVPPPHSSVKLHHETVEQVRYEPEWEKFGLTEDVWSKFSPEQRRTILPYVQTDRVVKAGDPRFHAKLKEIGDLHDRKQVDYGTQSDPFANVRGSQEWGIPPWVGAMVRANDKMHRLQQFAKKGYLANESVKDSLLDLAVYSLIALVLLEEEEQRETRTAQPR